MTPPPTGRPVAAAALIERYDDCLLIVTVDAADAVPRTWRFPRGSVKPDEFAESALRRVVLEELGVGIEIVVGEPPVLCQVDGVETEVRYFFCGLSAGEPKSGPYAAIEWVKPGRLGDYTFDGPSQPVADWLKEQARSSSAVNGFPLPSNPAEDRPIDRG